MTIASPIFSVALYRVSTKKRIFYFEWPYLKEKWSELQNGGYYLEELEETLLLNTITFLKHQRQLFELWPYKVKDPFFVDTLQSVVRAFWLNCWLSWAGPDPSLRHVMVRKDRGEIEIGTTHHYPWLPPHKSLEILSCHDTQKI